MALDPPPRKRRRIAVVQDTVICRLSDDVLLHIFGYLDVLSVLRSSRTCRQWHRLAADRTLWQHVDVTRFKMDTKRLWKFIRRHGSDKMKSLSVRGLATDPAKLGKKKAVLISSSLAADINSRCSNLEHLHLFNCDLRDLQLSNLPTMKLRTLHLHNCVLSANWLQVDIEVEGRRGRRECILPHLNTLNLHQSAMIARYDLIQITYLSQLKHLDLSQCYRVDDQGLMTVSEHVPGIVYLNISGCTRVTDASMHRVGRHLNQLRVLEMKNLFRLTDLGISCIANMCHKLEVLDISLCTAVSDASVMELATKLSQLKKLNVSLCHQLSDNCLESISLLLPSCLIITKMTTD